MTIKKTKAAKAAQDTLTFDLSAADMTAELRDRARQSAEDRAGADRIDINDPTKSGSEAVADALKAQ